MITIRYHNSTHAPLIERFMGREAGFETVGEPERDGYDFPRVDPETGAEIRALGGPDHRYNRDYKVGSSYPKCTFITAIDGDNESPTHDELEQFLRDRNLWSDHLQRVLLPKDVGPDGATWYHGFQYTPVERSPSLQRLEDRFDRRDSMDYHRTDSVLETWTTFGD